MGCKLIVKKGPTIGTEYDLDQVEIFMGRDLGNDIVVNDPEISRRHARIYKQGGQYMIEDLGSTNGTIVNGQKIRGPKQLTNHDYLAVGQNIGYEFISEEPLSFDAQTIAMEEMNFDEGATLVAEDSAPILEVPEAEGAYMTPDIPQEFSGIPVGAAPSFPQFPSTEQEVPAVYSTGDAIPDMPVISQPAKAASGKKKFPIWLIILVILLAVACICVGVIWIIDSQNLWCTILPFLPGC